MASGARAERVASREEFAWVLGSLCALARVPFDPHVALGQFPPPWTAEKLLAALSALGFRVGEAAALGPDTPLPCIAFRRAGEGAALAPAIVAQAEGGSVRYFEPGAREPASLGLAAFREAFEPGVLLVRHEAAAPEDPDAGRAPQGGFGFGWFVPELLRHKRVWREVLAASLAIQLVGLATPLFTQVVIDKVVVHHTQSTLWVVGVALALFMLFGAAMTWMRQYLVRHTGQRSDAVLGAQVFDRLLRLPLPYLQQRPTGVIAARLQGIETIREFIASAAVTVALDLPFLVIFVAIMFWYSVALTLMVLAILTLIVGASLLVAPLFQEKLNEQFRRGAANQAFLTEYVAGIETVKSLQFEPQLNPRYRGLLAEYLNAGFATRQLANTYNTWANGLEQLMTLLILVLGAWIVMHGTRMTIGMLVAFQMFAGRISQPMLRMAGLWQQWQQTRLAVARLGDIMNAPPEPFSLQPRRAPGQGAGAVQVEDLAFRYDEHRPPLFERLSLEIRPGELLALTGPSGSGKSTLARLLQGFHAPSGGRIRLDGIDIAHLAANELRAFFGVVPQETVLFSGTILENLQLANPYATFEQVVAACRMAEIHGTIEALPGGYQTPIGERGVGLSGGQRQRLAIARALLKGPKILIFDEATSSLDSPTAEQVGRTISALKGKVSILFIAHQMPRSLAVDRVVRIGEKLSVVSPPAHDPLGQGAAG